MDPITAALVAALDAGVLSGTTEVGKNLLVDAYNVLKVKLTQRLGEQSRVVKSVALLEESPDSEESKVLVHEAVLVAKADQDPELQQVAQAVLAQVCAQPGGVQYIQNVTGNFNATVNGTYNYAGTAGPVSLAYRGILGLPPPTDSRTIEQRTPLVQAVYARLFQLELNALVLTGIGGVGKSTLTALLYHYSQVQHGTSTSSFVAPPLWLSVDQSTTFADVVGTLFQELGKPAPELGNLSPSNQAMALFSLLDTQEAPCLVVLDQFENLLDWTTDFALSTKAGVGEWLDVLNGQCWKRGSRMLLTSRPRPKGTRAYPVLLPFSVLPPVWLSAARAPICVVRAAEDNNDRRCERARLESLPRTGILLILQQTHAQIEDAALVSSHEERKGILVSLLTGFHQLCFVLLILLTDGTG